MKIRFDFDLDEVLNIQHKIYSHSEITPESPHP
jgi:hypothetical protein